MAENGHLPSGGGGGGSICIPVHDSDEVVRVPLEELPEDPEELLEVLQAEEASLTLWLDFAKAYLARGRLQQCRVILEAGTSDEVLTLTPCAPVVTTDETKAHWRAQNINALLFC